MSKLVRPQRNMRIALSIIGIASTLLVAYWGIWFSANAEPDTFTVKALVFWLGWGLIVGSPFLILAIFAARPTFLGRMARMVGGLALIVPGWLFGGIALEHSRRVLSGGPFLLGSFTIGCAGLLAVILGVVYVIIMEINDRGEAGGP